MKRTLLLSILVICLTFLTVGCSKFVLVPTEKVKAEDTDEKPKAEDILEKAKKAFSEVTYLELGKDMLIGGESDEQLTYSAYLNGNNRTIYELLTSYSGNKVSFEIENYYDLHDLQLDAYTCYIQEGESTKDWYYTKINNQNEIEDNLYNYTECYNAVSPFLFERYAIDAVTLTEDTLNETDCYLLTYDSEKVTNAAKEEIIVMYLDKETYYPVLVTSNITENNIVYDTTYKISNVNEKQSVEIPAEAKAAMATEE